YPPSIDGIFESGFPSGFMAFAPKIIDTIIRGDNAIENAATFEDGVNVQRVLDAARRSSETGERTRVSP
ncbi:MAG TPA: hypothetical protein DEP46_11625, partial [Blastocatellia bacterium]|nr:hypothetical protein [Blastocatellia bacterium]